MGDPFLRANRRLIRRLGNPINATDDTGNAVPDLYGIYENPEKESLVKAKNGGLTLKRRGHTLQVLTEDVPTLSKQWVFNVSARVFYPAHWDDDGTGWTLIYLSVTPNPTPKDEQANGNTWR